MKLRIESTGVQIALTLEVDTSADFGAGLGVLLDRAADLKLLLMALDGDSNDDDNDDTDSDDGDGGPDDDPSGTAVDRLLSEMGIGTG